MKAITRLLFSSLTLGLVITTNMTNPAEASKKDNSICEDDLTTRSGLRWGGSKKLPFKKVVDIRDCLVNSPLGKVTADRHGNKQTKNLFNGLFGGRNPKPGERYFISLWGSKIEGCFIEMVVQDAPKNGQVEMQRLVPTKLELGVGGQLIELPADFKIKPKVFSGDYSYNDYSAGYKRELSSTWFMTRNLFTVDSQILEFLRNAPKEEVTARLTFLDKTSELLKVRVETVKSWGEAFGFNPNCRSPEAQALLGHFQNAPLVATLDYFQESAKQTNALNWLQSQISPATLGEFAKRWRNDGGRNGSPISMADAFKYYQKSAAQKNAVSWLQGQLSQDILQTYLSQYL